MNHPRRFRLGFSLPEVLVAITLIAILASVVIPAVVAQVRKGDPLRVGNDMVAIRTGVEAFLADIRRYPGDIGHLMTPITITQEPLNGTMGSGPPFYTYGLAETSRWRGPYLNEDATSVLKTGFGWSFKSKFDYDGYGVTGTVGNSGVATNQKYMVLTIPITNQASALLLDQMFDDGDLTAGTIRYRVCTTAPACAPSSASDTVKYLLLPIY